MSARDPGNAGSDPRRPLAPGLLILHLDGVGAPTLDAARADGLAPCIDAILRTSHRMLEWTCGLPSDTLPVQAALFWGAPSPAPSFAWWDRRARHVRTAVSPRTVEMIESEMEARHGPGLLRDGGCHGAAIGGGASLGSLVIPGGRRSWRQTAIRSARSAASVARWRLTMSHDEILRGSDQIQWRSHPDAADDGRGVERTCAERAPIDAKPRGSLFARGASAAGRIAGAIAGSGAIRDIRAGLPVVFASLVEHDLLAHLSGPTSAPAMGAIRAMDRQVARVLAAIAGAPRPYRVVILSDHGSSPATPAPAALRPDPRAWVAAEWTRRRRTGAPAGLEVAASGTLLQAWVRDANVRATRSDLERMAPGFVASLARHPAVSFVIVGDEPLADGSPTALAIGPGGGTRLRAGVATRPSATVVERWGTPPFAADGDCDGVASFGTRPEVGDVACIGSREVAREQDPGAYWTFESQAGAHGGIGGEQARPFVIAPVHALPPIAWCADTFAIHAWLRSLLPPG